MTRHTPAFGAIGLTTTDLFQFDVDPLAKVEQSSRKKSDGRPVRLSRLSPAGFRCKLLVAGQACGSARMGKDKNPAAWRVRTSRVRNAYADICTETSSGSNGLSLLLLFS